MESMTDDQIAKLSEEFDRRTQDDGIINCDNRSSRGPTPHRDSPDREVKRKTSYTEITLSSPPAKGNYIFLSYILLQVNYSFNVSTHVLIDRRISFQYDDVYVCVCYYFHAIDILF